MRRLVYVPKVNAWVKTDLGIIDLSPYIVRGTVNRKTNQVSAATLSFRNPQKKFTEYRFQDGTIGPLIHPMDPIIITLTRLRGRPIQVFTGYVDQSPYLKLYPGVVDLAASCTLKRLQYRFWDPGLDYTWRFLSSYGWFPDQAHGGVFAPAAETKDLKTVTQFNDGSIANLLFAVLRDVGGWDESTIFIEPLPKTIGPLIVRLFQLFQDEQQQNQDIQTGFEDLLTQLIGTSAMGGGGSGGSGDSTDFGSTQVPRTVYCAGVSMGVPARHLLGAMAVGLVECPCNGGGGPGCTGFGFGNCQGGDGTSQGWRQETSSSYPNVDRRDVRASATRFFREMAQLDTGQPVGELCQNVQRSANPTRYSEVIASGDAQRLLDAVKKLGCSNSSPSTGRNPGERPG